MLSSQRREFDDKKQDESAYPVDFGRWFALDYFLRPRVLKGARFYVTLGVTVLVTLASLASLLPGFQRAHQAGPVSKAHAMFNQNCANCHDQAFQPVWRLFGCKEATSISDAKCSECHDGAPHHKKDPHTSACANCHREHLGHETLASHVADRNCSDCHRDLAEPIKRATHFNHDHPEFQPSLKGKKDPAKIKFNHKVHLDLDLDALREAQRKVGRDDLHGIGAKMACVDCHRMDADGKYVQPIRYDEHCARCHALNAPLVGDFAKDLKAAAIEFQRTPLPHREPAIVRAVLRDRLVAFEQKHGVVLGKGPELARPLPWKPVTPEQWMRATEAGKKIESLVFLHRQWKAIEPLTGCSHCHVEKGSADGLPIYEKSAIPDRWYKQSLFNHGSHRMMSCVECHDRNASGVKVADSQSAVDILLPNLESCQQCHTGERGGARNACVECHRYHDRTQARSYDGMLKLQEIVSRKK